jgi:DNA recombination protein RmuC
MSTLDIILIAAVIISVIIVGLIQHSIYTKKLAVVNERFQQQVQMAEQLQQLAKSLQTEKENLIEQIVTAQSQLQFLNEQYNLYKRYQKENEILTSQLSMFKAKFQAAEEKLENQKKEVEQMGEHFRFEFKNLAQNILEEKTEKFAQLYEEKMNAILTPLKTQLVDFKQKMEETYDKESKELFSLRKEVQRLIEMSSEKL